MLNIYGKITTIVVTIGFSGIAHSYQINPQADKYWKGSNISGKVYWPLHEELTYRARECEEGQTGSALLLIKCSTDIPSPGANPKGNKQDSLIRGVWWNDDPNQLLFGWGYRHAKWSAWMRDGNLIAKTGRNYKGKDAKITQNYYMQYRSHYGDLQFLHAMASSDNQPAAVTQADILSWAEFAYLVATGRIDAETKFKDVDTTDFQKHFSHQQGWTINYLFAPTYRLSERKYTSQMALGSLLHVIQDSYSRGHTLRDFSPSTACPSGRVIQFYSYTHQDTDQHHQTDKLASWKAQGLTAPQDPVTASANVIRFANKRAEWAVVKDYLQDVVFCTDSDAIASGPGEYAVRKGDHVAN